MDRRKRNFLGNLRGCFPIVEWLPSYKKEWLSPDLIAGTTLAAFTIPEAIAYSDLAGMPPPSGTVCLYCGASYLRVLRNTRQLAVGPTSAVSVLVASALGGLMVPTPRPNMPHWQR